MNDHLTWQGKFSAARSHLEQGIAQSSAQPRGASPSRSAMAPRVTSHGYLGWTLWPLGYPDHSLRHGQEALALADELGLPFSQAVARLALSICHEFRGEMASVQQQAEANIALSTEHEFPTWAAMSKVLYGWTLVQHEQPQDGLAQIQQGMQAYQAIGQEVVRPYFLGLLAQAWSRTGQTKEGLGALAEALSVVETTGERWYEAELYRIKGELVLNDECRTMNAERQAPKVNSHQLAAEAEASFQQAIEIARNQQAKSRELRASMSLARLWQQQDKKNEAYTLLSETYSWFTEGFETKDLQEAKTLLDELIVSL